MIEARIKELQNELNNLIDKGCDYSELYCMSVKLDKLICEYYKRRLFKS